MGHLKDIATGVFKHLMNAFLLVVGCIAIGLCAMAVFLEVMIFITKP